MVLSDISFGEDFGGKKILSYILILSGVTLLIFSQQDSVTTYSNKIHKNKLKPVESKEINDEWIPAWRKKKDWDGDIIDYLYGYFTNKSKNILEFGCGDGYQIEFLKKISNNVIAIDRKIDPDLKNKNFEQSLKWALMIPHLMINNLI